VELKISGLKFWGSPITPWFNGENWANNKHRGDEIMETWKLIPKDTDILITHGPAFGHLDYIQNIGRSGGCEDLRKVIDEIRPKICLSGHLHFAYGMKEHYYKDETTTIFSNASICNDNYIVINKPNIIEL
jgi:Icc-related predicted phosphoesterase